ncbi:YidC/Oxa1 family membrane protein insertase [Candidatus Phytoplasma fraxini]|uniref:YidC/Oxa1 family membrane protein insertase n=1 Tax=Ash yellows phytoplasma TaxID=35780 RepID=A0ABZ2U8X2_ASHYP
MNNIQNKNDNKLLQKFLFFCLLCFSIYFIIKHFYSQQVEPSRPVELKIIFTKNKLDEKAENFKIKHFEEQKSISDFLKQQNIQIFEVIIDDNSKSVIFQHLDTSKITSVLEEKIKTQISKILRGEDNCFYLDKDETNVKKISSRIKDFFTIKVGTKLEYFETKYNDPKDDSLKVGRIVEGRLEPYSITNFPILLDKQVDAKSVKDNKDEYNKRIRTRKNKDNNNYFYLKYDNMPNPPNYIQIFVDNSGDLPIQWPDKKEWNFFIGWGYIWNVLLVVIGSFLDFFSNIFINPSCTGVFFGNLGLGIILTTICIRTLTWPIYTKSSTFSMNMSLAQPEINRIQAKYILKKDKEDVQRMQMEIMKVYRKHNFNIFSIFISFLQIPILMAIYRALNRFRTPGGIFAAKYKTPFLGFIELDLFSSSFNDNTQVIVRIFLSLIVAITMFLLNKHNLKKPSYLKTNNSNLNAEQKLKQKNQEKTMKIVSYITILFMFTASFQDSILSLYWITGNIYTLFQVIINANFIKKKYNLLKQKDF